MATIYRALDEASSVAGQFIIAEELQHAVPYSDELETKLMTLRHWGFRESGQHGNVINHGTAARTLIGSVAVPYHDRRIIAELIRFGEALQLRHIPLHEAMRGTGAEHWTAWLTREGAEPALRADDLERITQVLGILYPGESLQLTDVVSFMQRYIHANSAYFATDTTGLIAEYRHGSLYYAPAGSTR